MAFKKILRAIDFSEESLEAFRRAAELARLSAAQLYVLHTVEALPFVKHLLGIDEMGETAIELEEKATAALESLVASSAKAPEGVPLKLEVITGRAFVEILIHASEWSADLIMLGARGAAALEQIVLGSAAERVMKAASCSVLIVKRTLYGNGEKAGS